MKIVKSFAEFWNQLNEAGKPGKEPVAKKKPRKNPWWKKFTQYQLSAYPVNIPREQVKIDLKGDIDTHWVLSWPSAKTGRMVYAYTKNRVESQKAKKYDRTSNISEESIERIKTKCHESILSSKTSEEEKEAAAVVCIIANSGLRPGSKKGFEITENRGVVTLSRDNVKINKNKISLNFIGKSYQENNAEIQDGVLANYLSTKMKKKKEFLFDISHMEVSDYYKQVLNMSEFKIKDLRTYIAGSVAKDFFKNDPLAPPPVPDDPSKIKKLVKAKLKRAFEVVSAKLNNSPAMAQKSYVNPGIVDGWLTSIGIQPAFLNESEYEEDEEGEELGDALVWDLPEWWEDDGIELVKI